MNLKKISLQNFRNFGQKNFEFVSKTTVIVGPNTSGKTNILEAIFLTAAGKSFRAEVEQEMIAYEKELARVSVDIIKDGEKVKLEVILTRGELAGERVGKKKLMVNGIAKRMVDFVGRVRAVVFRPEDLDLVTDSPNLRRRYLDLVLSQIDREYRRAMLSYEKGLRQRNRLLLRIRDEGASRSQLLFWDKLLIRNGEYLSTTRAEFIDFLNNYKSVFEYKVFYDRSVISQLRLMQYAEEEVLAGATLVGPHRDDFNFLARQNGRDLSSFGSRGEQRLAVLWLKLGELAFLEKESSEAPLLLLDDIFSELDHPHREIVFEVVGRQQTIITTADPHTIEDWRKNAQVIEL